MRRELIQIILLLSNAAIYFNSALASNFGLQKVYKAVINDTTLPSTQLFTVDVMDAMGYGIGGEMSDGFAIDPHTGVVSITQQIDVGRYEFVITVSVQSGSNLLDIALFVGLVDVLSTVDGCDNQILYGMCSHTCVADSNDPNGYYCQCYNGYSLQRNGYICRVNDPEPSLLMSYTSGGLAKLDTFTRKIDIIANDTQIKAFDYHYGYQIIYYTDGNTLYSVDINGQNTVRLYELSQVTSIAVNWLNSDIYFTAVNGIEKITITSTVPVRKSVLSGRSSPRHLVLDAEDGVMYWIEGSDSDASIYKAALDGSGIIRIATNLNNSQDLSVDIVEHRVYWNAVSGSIYQIQSAVENGSDITTVHDSDILQSASISVFEDYVYSAKESTQLILRVDKYTRLTGVNVTLSADEDVDIIKVYHRLKQPNSAKDTDECAVNNAGCSQICNNVIEGFSCECFTGYQQNQLDPSSCLVPETCSATGCDHSCVLDSSNVASCVCDPGYEVSDDELACLDINECAGSHGCSHGCTNTNGSFLCTCPEGLFLSEDRRNCNGCAVNNGGCGQICMQDSVGYSCSCLDGYTLGSDGKDCHYSEVPELLVSSSRRAISTYNGRVYLVETDGTELERNVDINNRDLNTGLIYAIEYNLDIGRIYFSDRNTSTLWTASLDNEIRASDDRQLVTTETVNAWAFAYDWISECLYWSDDRSNRIGELDEQSATVEYIAQTTGSPRGIAVDPFYRKIFWSEPSGIISFNLDSNETTTIYTSINEPSGLTIDILQERIFFVENMLSSQSNIYSTDYYGQDQTLIVENYPSVIPFQIAYADNFIYWTRNNRQLERARIPGSSLVSSVPVTLQTESGFDSSFFSLVAVSTLHRPPSGICYPNPCLNGGLCSDNGQGLFSCFCKDNYFGENCTLQNHCMVNPCQNGGLCNLSTENPSGFSCQCPDGYIGDKCQQQNFCRNIECENGGTCENRNNSFICVCTAGYTGDTCDVNIDDCDGVICQNGGNCVDQVNAFICNCTAGYTGDTCDVNIDDCDGVICQNGGNCVDQVNAFICNCTAGYTGDTCNVNIDDCDGVICQNGGNCVDQVNAFICNCTAGYTGDTCDVNIDDCDGVICQNGGTCVDQVNAFICNCTAGYTGDTCDVNIDDCDGVICQNGGTCVDQVNNFSCSCVSGYTGDTCNVNIDDCDGVICQNEGICVDQVNAFICNCTAGYTGDTCDVNIDDCDGVICQNGGTCVDQVNAFICNCTAGYTGDTCNVNIDDCDGVICQNGGTCVDQVNTFICNCTAGYTGDTCDVNIDDCDGVICQNGGTCVDQVNAFICNCTAGYTGDTCNVNIDDCDGVICQNGGTCVDQVNTFICNCTAGYTGDTCDVNIDDCDGVICQNGGTCVDQVNAFICNCTAGYTGDTCDVNIDDCDGVICQNGGTCVDQVNNFSCSCVSSYTGEFCGMVVDNCVSAPCQNGGICQNGNNTFICNCTAGYTGEICDVNIDDCDGVVCQNGGTCVDQVNGFICNCTAGYNGETCDVNIDDCDGVICQNQGTCIDQVNGFICSCTAGYTGETCDVNIDDCDGVICQNGGTCIDQVNGFICNCTAGYTGETCDVNINDCEGITCQNGGTCVDQVNSFFCDCVDGYTGDRCETPICTEPCQNGGTCIAPGECRCTEFLGGPTCTIPICPENFCVNGGTCSPGSTGATCSCPQGFFGTRCENRDSTAFGRIEGGEEGLTRGETAGVSVGSILGAGVIIILLMFTLFFGHRYWRRRMSFKTVHGNTMYGNPVYHEASDIGGKDVLGNEQALDNPVYGIYSKPADDNLQITADNNTNSDGSASMDTASNDVLMEHVYVNTKVDLPQDAEDSLNSNDIV